MGQLLEVLKGIKIPEGAKKAVDEADALYTSRIENASYVQHLEAEIEKLQAELEKLRAQKGVSTTSGGLTFNKTTGTHVESSTGLHTHLHLWQSRVPVSFLRTTYHLLWHDAG